VIATAGLAPGAEVSLVISCSSLPTADNLYLLAEVDLFDSIVESDESNNLGFVAFP
jgi:hypothetical protein